MHERSSDYTDGVADVSIIVPLCFENPLTAEAHEFVLDILSRRKKVALPTSTLIGAYHICTSYLGVPRLVVKRILDSILASESTALFPLISTEIAEEALEYASVYGVEAWDGCLVSIARSFGSSVVYSMDEDLSKVKEVSVLNPFSDEKVRRYHKHIESRLKAKRR